MKFGRYTGIEDVYLENEGWNPNTCRLQMIFLPVVFFESVSIDDKLLPGETLEEVVRWFSSINRRCSVQKGRSNIKKSLLGGSQRHWVTR